MTEIPSVVAYDALTSDRNYRKRYLPHEAIEYLMASADTHFSLDLVRNFTQHVAPYPPGTTVELSTGDLGIVGSVDMTISTRPSLRMVRNAKGLAYPTGEELDLRKYPSVTITKVIEG